MINMIICHYEGKRRIVMPLKHPVMQLALSLPRLISPYVIESARVGNNTTSYAQLWFTLDGMRYHWRQLHARVRA